MGLRAQIYGLSALAQHDWDHRRAIYALACLLDAYLGDWLQMYEDEDPEVVAEAAHFVTEGLLALAFVEADLLAFQAAQLARSFDDQSSHELMAAIVLARAVAGSTGDWVWAANSLGVLVAKIEHGPDQPPSRLSATSFTW